MGGGSTMSGSSSFASSSATALGTRPRYFMTLSIFSYYILAFFDLVFNLMATHIAAFNFDFNQLTFMLHNLMLFYNFIRCVLLLLFLASCRSSPCTLLHIFNL
jgi:hypothetical protein